MIVLRVEVFLFLFFSKMTIFLLLVYCCGSVEVNFGGYFLFFRQDYFCCEIVKEEVILSVTFVFCVCDAMGYICYAVIMNDLRVCVWYTTTTVLRGTVLLSVCSRCILAGVQFCFARCYEQAGSNSFVVANRVYTRIFLAPYNISFSCLSWV